MTVSSSVARRRTIGKILRRSAQLAGVLSTEQALRPADREWLREALEDILDGLSTYGVSARAQAFDELTITDADVAAGTFKFDLSADVLNVAGNAMYITSGQADAERAAGETLVTQVSLRQWHEISSKDATADRPTWLYPHHENDTIQAWLWQIPSDAGTLRLPVERHLADVDNDNATLDLQTYWYRAITHELAASYMDAKTLDVEARVLMSSKAGKLMGKAVGRSLPDDDLQTAVGGSDW